MHDYRAHLETLLNDLFDRAEASLVYEAMRYSTLGGGKRFRAALVYYAADCFAVPRAQVDAAAIAVELIHAYSLIHDDLPAMDNDDFRRGKPSNHKAFGEATAILAGDALNTLAFEVLSQSALPSLQQVAQIRLLAQAAGASGMVGGQMLDMAATAHNLSEAELTTLHQRKTGALIEASLQLGALPAPNYPEHQATLSALGRRLGLWYQVQDDVLDCISDDVTLGKTAGKDAEQGKNTFVRLWGLTACQHWLTQEQHALKALCEQLPQAGAPLWRLIEQMSTRQF